MFDIGLIDPPSSFNDRRLVRKDGKMAKRGISSGNIYPCLSTRELCELPMGKLFKKDAILFVWSINSKPQETLDCINAWGFTFKTVMFTWAKVCKNDTSKLFFGTGHYTAQNTERLLIARRGKKLQHVRNDIMELQFAPHPRPLPEGKIKHSAKPACFRFLIDLMYPGFDKIELFARNCHPGWFATGLEYDRVDIRDLLRRFFSWDEIFWV